jgi:hypothetical protein
VRLKLYQFLMIALLGACAGKGSVKPSENATIYKLDANYKIESMYATETVDVDESVNSNRYLFRRSGAPDEVLLVLFPEAMNDQITITLEKMETTLLRSDVNRQYLDLSAEVYRHILRGETTEAGERLAHMLQKFGRTFSYYFFSGLIAIANRDPESAMKAFAIAKDLNPDAQELDKFVADLAAGLRSGEATR